MPPRKKLSAKQEFFERGQKLLQDAENSKNPAIAKLRTKMAKRYFTQDTRGDAKVSPPLALSIGTLYIVAATISGIYCARVCDSKTFAAVVIVSILFALILFVFLFALTGVMTEATIAKTIIRMWDKVIAKLKLSF
jgi:hypothetical protein